MVKIGLVPMSAKPYHIGHDMLVRMAASENDLVLLFISTSDRARSGELRVSGDTMQMIWWDYIEPTLPQNATPDYGGVPVAKVYAELEKAEAKKSIDTYFIYSDDEDILKYTDKNLKAAAPTMFAKGQIKRRGVSRTETVDVSGTEMRDLLDDRDLVGFVSLLPPNIKKHGKEIFDLLLDDIVGESLLRKYIKMLTE